VKGPQGGPLLRTSGQAAFVPRASRDSFFLMSRVNTTNSYVGDDRMVAQFVGNVFLGKRSRAFIPGCPVVIVLICGKAGRFNLCSGAFIAFDGDIMRQNSARAFSTELGHIAHRSSSRFMALPRKALATRRGGADHSTSWMINRPLCTGQRKSGNLAAGCHKWLCGSGHFELAIGAWSPNAAGRSVQQV